MILSKKNINQIDLDFLLNEKIKNGKLNETLIVVPTNRKVRSLKRELISLSPARAAANLHIHTLSTLSLSLFKLAFTGDFFLLDDATAIVLLNRAFSKVKPKYFSIYKDEIPYGTLERIKNVISEYKRNGVSPEVLLNQADKLTGSEKLKASDIAKIYSIYFKECRKNNLYEIGDVYSYLNNLSAAEFKKVFHELFSEVNLILINGFDEFSNPEIDLLNRISLLCEDLFIQFDYYKFNPSLFSHLDECFEKLEQKGFKEIRDLSESQQPYFYSLIRARLFNYEIHKSEITNEKVFLLNPATPEKEIELIAKKIKQLMFEESVPPEKICVAFNLITEHSKIIRDVFSEYGIPFNLTDRFALSESQPVIAIINLLEIVENNFYYKNIFRTLSGKWIELDGIDLSNLLLVASNLKIVSGFNNWIESIDNKLAEISDLNQDEENNFLPSEHYIKAKEDILKIAEILEPLKQKLNVREFQSGLKNLIIRFNIIPKAINDHSDYAEKNVRALTSFVQTLDNLFELMKIEVGEKNKFTLGFYLRNIKAALQFARYNLREKIDSGILITSINEIRDLRFDYLFIGGMTDGEFPTRYQPEIFLSGSFRKEEYKHLLEERYHFYQALCTVRKNLYLSFPQNEEKKKYTASTFLKELKNVFQVIEENTVEYDKLIASEKELLSSINVNEINSDSVNQLLSQAGFDSRRILEEIKIDEERLTESIEDESGNNPSQSIYNGYLNNELNAEAIEKLKQLSEKTYSATQLEEYVKCPFQYFLRRILFIEKIEEPTEEIEAFEIGSLVHSILYTFYKTITEQKKKIENCTDEEFADFVKLIFSIAEKKTENIKFSSPYSFFEQEKIFGINGNKKHSILYKFLEEERKEKQGFTPKFFELAFGTKNNLSAEVKLSDLKFRGMIDRIDVNENKNLYKVIDYKLGGRKPSKDDLNSAISLQLPLYLYASRMLLKAEFEREFKPAAAEIYSLKIFREEFGRKVIHNLSGRNLTDDDLILASEELIKIFEEAVPKYIGNIRRGIFHLSKLEKREEKVCGFCEFKSICRIQEVG
ncbi:PD-(D/E)XK nuclease family protein [Ignavibacterium sp.]|uniref:PD-(D/E)XK nuclease family protein n=1 Tax=Ignavibacterium sp. TaxID=2651167 RepID=UPI00307F8A2D